MPGSICHAPKDRPEPVLSALRRELAFFMVLAMAVVVDLSGWVCIVYIYVGVCVCVLCCVLCVACVGGMIPSSGIN